MSLRAYRKLLAASTLVLAAAACTDLGVQPKSTITSSNVFNDPNSYQAFLGKLYAGLQVTGQTGPYGSGDIQSIADEGFSGYNRLLWNLQELPTDEAAIAWGDGSNSLQSLNTQTWVANNDFVGGMYARIYFQVGLANEFLRQSTGSMLSARGQSGSAALVANVKMYRAEARFIRALAYYHGIDLFGNIPIVDENFTIGATPPKQNTRAEVFAFIESELKAIRDSLPPAGLNPDYYGRANKTAADMLLAHLYLNAEVYTGTPRWSDARVAAEAVIAAPGYQLAPRWQDNFLADNNLSPEIIFSIPSDGIHQQSYGGMTTIVHAAVGPGMNPSDYGLNGGWWGTRTRREFVAILGGANNADARSQVLITDSHTLDIQVLKDHAEQGLGVGKYKNVTKGGVAGSSGEFVDTDFPLFRLADAYLIYAEAVARGGGGSAATAVGYINALRRRAYGSTAGDITTGDLTPRFVLDERGRELYWEAWRRSDLVRFGLFTGGGYIWQWKGNTMNGTATDSHLNLYPIPAQQLTANPNLKQNPGY